MPHYGHIADVILGNIYNAARTPTWAQGTRRIITIEVTPGNVTTDLSPGAGKRWLFLYGWLCYSSDATVITRYLELMLMGAAGEILPAFPRKVAGQTDSQINYYNYCGVVSGLGAVTALHVNIGLGENIIIDGTDMLRIYPREGRAGDEYFGWFAFLEVTL